MTLECTDVSGNCSAGLSGNIVLQDHENPDPKPANNCFSFASLIVKRRYHLRRSKSHMEQLTAHGHIEPSDIPDLLLGIQDDLG